MSAHPTKGTQHRICPCRVGNDMARGSPIHWIVFFAADFISLVPLINLLDGHRWGLVVILAGAVCNIWEFVLVQTYRA